MNSAVPLTPPNSSTDPSGTSVPLLIPASATDAAAARGPEHIRSDIRTQPTVSAPGDFAVTLKLLDRIERLQALSEGMVRKIEQESGLRRSEFMLLRALEGGESHPRRVGRLVGLQTDAVLATAQSLASRGFLGIEHTQDDAVALILADSGRSVLTQAEAVQIRITDAAIQHLGPEGAARTITVLDNMIDAMALGTDGGLPTSVNDLATGA